MVAAIGFGFGFGFGIGIGIAHVVQSAAVVAMVAALRAAGPSSRGSREIAWEMWGRCSGDAGRWRGAVGEMQGRCGEI
jgi:hypothetical protein